jgi:hypothetical protein
MNEMILEKLIQKVSNMLSDVNDMNLLIRTLKPSQEVLTATLSRLDAMQGVLKEIEAALKEKNVQLAGIETRLKQVPAAMAELQKTMADLPAKFGVSPAAIKELKGVMGHLLEQLDQPQKQEVVHRHIVKPIAITVFGYFIALVLSIMLVNWRSKIDVEKGREAKYRWLQAADISGVNLALYHADSLYLANPDEFEEETLELEIRQQALRSQRTRSDQSFGELEQMEREFKKR